MTTITWITRKGNRVTYTDGQVQKAFMEICPRSPGAKINKIALRKLADYLQDKVANEQFNTRFYRAQKLTRLDGKSKEYSYLEASRFYSQTRCGTVGCGIGWAPFVEGLNPINSDYSHGYLIFELYGQRIFGLDPEEYNYLFMPENYGDVCDIPKQAVIDRILHFINK